MLERAGVLLEVGPGQALASLARQQTAATIVSSLPPVDRSEAASLLEAAGRLWSAGVPLDWEALEGGGRRVSLPTYPFERRRFPVPIGAHRAALRGAPVQWQPPSADTATEAAIEIEDVPRDPVEEQIAALWCEALGLAQVGVTSNFLSLGGDSLLANQVLARMRELFAIDVRLKWFLDRPTVADLALGVVEEQAGGAAALEALLTEIEAGGTT
jgi:acyl transferase domain-containing protein